MIFAIIASALAGSGSATYRLCATAGCRLILWLLREQLDHLPCHNMHESDNRFHANHLANGAMCGGRPDMKLLFLVALLLTLEGCQGSERFEASQTGANPLL
jgi:hypothetical protein